MVCMASIEARPLDPAVEDQLFARLARGDTLLAICRTPGMPCRELVYANRKAYPDFLERYEHARMMGNDALAEQVIDFVDAEPGRTAKGQVDNGHVAWSRLRMDARLKLLPHWDRRYAEKMDVGNRDGESLKVDTNVDTAALTVALAKALRAQKDDGDGA